MSNGGHSLKTYGSHADCVAVFVTSYENFCVIACKTV